MVGRMRYPKTDQDPYKGSGSPTATAGKPNLKLPNRRVVLTVVCGTNPAEDSTTHVEPTRRHSTETFHSKPNHACAIILQLNEHLLPDSLIKVFSRT
ncbi:unnamed protein product [Hymenolepis diminuta]|uniref:Uncharacterized protein n=1 Tax=Hymenolepis diminuta TaxID=6216 RepID=A0A3P6ZK18_HYMDI|nr:unnamed protein product [Hymenolepis diminuta]